MTNSNHPIGNRRRAAFTLVELLLVVAIIGVLASLALAVVAGAQDEARRSATVARLGQIRAMMLDRIESYEYRRIPVRLQDLMGDEGGNREKIRRIKNRIIADMISVEMPRKGPSGPGPQRGQFPFPSSEFRIWLEDPTVLGNTPMPLPDTRTAAQAMIEALENHRSMIVVQIEQIEALLSVSSEGLAFVLATTDVDGTSGIDALGSKAFVDVDGDGLVSVVDSWNDEISYEFNLTDENGNLYLDPNPPPNTPPQPLDLKPLIGNVEVYDIPIQNIVVAFKTVNPL